MKKGRASFYS